MELKKGPLTNHFLNTVLYVSSVAALRPAGFKEAVNNLQWNELWIFSFMFAAVIFENLLQDWFLLNGHDIAWQKMNGFVDQEILDDRRKLLLFEHCETSVTKGFANGALILMMLAVAASFVWFTFLA